MCALQIQPFESRSKLEMPKEKNSMDYFRCKGYVFVVRKKENVRSSYELAVSSIFRFKVGEVKSKAIQLAVIVSCFCPLFVYSVTLI